ncbi:MAG: hypothetical protein ABSA34_04885 [Candidatus Goldiibacteriota bacterium]|jgi:hypothetical protein
MKFDAALIVYYAGLLILIAAIAIMGVSLKKLTSIVKEKKLIWLLPVFAAAVLAVSLASHIYATFTMLPQLSVNINALSQAAVSQDASRLEPLKAAVASLKSGLVFLKGLSFTCFLLASAMLLASTSIYLRWISK